VTVDSQPPGAHILVDAKPQCDAPCSFTVAGGEHDLDAELEGYERARKHIRVELGRPLPVAIVLRTRMGRLIVYTRPDGAGVSLAGAIVGPPPPDQPAPAGPHRLEVRRYGFAAVRREIVLPAGQTLEVPLALTTLGPSVGAVEVRPPRPLPPPVPDE